MLKLVIVELQEWEAHKNGRLFKPPKSHLLSHPDGAMFKRSNDERTLRKVLLNVSSTETAAQQNIEFLDLSATFQG